MNGGSGMTKGPAERLAEILAKARQIGRGFRTGDENSISKFWETKESDGTVTIREVVLLESIGGMCFETVQGYRMVCCKMHARLLMHRSVKPLSHEEEECLLAACSDD